MGGLVESQVEDSIECVVRRDVELAQAIIGRDAKIDELQRDIERKAIRMIALRQPVAQDLRRTVAALKRAWNLERTGDQAKNIAKRALVLAEAEPLTPLTRAVERMGRLVVAHLKEALLVAPLGVDVRPLQRGAIHVARQHGSLLHGWDFGLFPFQK